MTAPMTKQHLTPLMSTNLTYRSPAVEQTTAQPGFNLGRLLANVVHYVVEFPRRQALLNELSRLSERELTDIGLTRGELRDVASR